MKKRSFSAIETEYIEKKNNKLHNTIRSRSINYENFKTYFHEPIKRVAKKEPKRFNIISQERGTDEIGPW